MSEEQQIEQTPEERAAAKAAEYKEQFAKSTTDGDVTEPVVRSGAEETAEVPAKPEGVPDKFYNAETGEIDYEAWGKAHHELESKFHKKPEDADSDAEGADEQTEEPAGIMERESVKAAREAFAKDGELTEDHYKAIEAETGFSKEDVDAWIEGQRTRAEAPFRAAYEAAGGEENYEAMAEWMRANLSEAEIEAYNVQVRTNDLSVIGAAVKSMNSRFMAEANIEGDRVGGGSGSAGSNVFGSRAEMAEAINALNERGQRKYDVDAAYRASVIKKIGATRKAGIAL